MYVELDLDSDLLKSIDCIREENPNVSREDIIEAALEYYFDNAEHLDEFSTDHPDYNPMPIFDRK